MKVIAARVGVRVYSLVDFVGVPAGTEGVIDEDYGEGVMVAWDLPAGILPPGYREYDGRPAIASRIVRDGFGNNELHTLAEVWRDSSGLCVGCEEPAVCIGTVDCGCVESETDPVATCAVHCNHDRCKPIATIDISV